MTVTLPTAAFAPSRPQDNPLEALDRAWRRIAEDRTLVRRGGRIT